MRNIIFVILLLIGGYGYSQNTFDERSLEGRELFLTNGIVDEIFNLEYEFHTPNYYNQNPILVADKSWEFNINGDPYAAPFSGGVWYDERDSLYKMWYSAGGNKLLGLITCYAYSYDGKSWIKPELDVVKGTNIVDTLEHDCVSVILDKYEENPAKRFKMFIVEFNSRFTVSMKLKYSCDGIHWSNAMALSGEIYDRCSAFYNPFIKKYVLSLKGIDKESGRMRTYIEHTDPQMLVSLAHRVFDYESDCFIKYWFAAEDDDPRNPDFPNIRPQIYNHDAIAYESLLLGYFTIWQGPENRDCDSLKIQKRNEVLLGFSYDGFNWNRDFKERFLAVSKDFNAWNAGNIQSVGGAPIIVGDSLYFYFSGRYNSKPIHDSNFSTGLAVLRRDGFVSLRGGDREGFVETEVVKFNGDYLFVNVDLEKKKGKLAVEILDKEGNVVPGFSKDDFVTIKGLNSTKAHLLWKGDREIGELKGKEVKFRFYLTRGDIYSFWVSNWESGESGGYTAGGGPGLHSSGVDVKIN